MIIDIKTAFWTKRHISSKLYRPNSHNPINGEPSGRRIKELLPRVGTYEQFIGSLCNVFPDIHTSLWNGTMVI